MYLVQSGSGISDDPERSKAMTITAYRQSLQIITSGDYEFYALLMAAMRKADTYNLAKLQEAFPQVWDELKQRYNAPGGAITQSELDWVKRLYDPQDDDDEQDDDDDDDI